MLVHALEHVDLDETARLQQREHFLARPLPHRERVLLAPAEHGHVADAPEMPREEAADHAGADYADAVDSVLRKASTPRTASARGSSRHSDPGSSASEKISRS